jgi:hypothetical protein
VGEDIHPFQDHLFSVHIARLPGLGIEGKGGEGRLSAVLFAEDLGHREPAGLRHRVEKRLGDAISQGERKRLSFGAQCLKGLCQGTEAQEVTGFKEGADHLFQELAISGGPKQALPPPDARILDARAIPDRHLAIP